MKKNFTKLLQTFEEKLQLAPYLLSGTVVALVHRVVMIAGPVGFRENNQTPARAQRALFSRFNYDYMQIFALEGHIF